MAELLILGLFAGVLLVCVAADVNILIALGIGFCLFFGYGLWKKHPAREVFRMALTGVSTVKNILITFFLIGIITALWRVSGTIACIVYNASSLCAPSVMPLITFLLCCLVSVLTGTSFGTAATMGVISVTMCSAMGISPLVSGGAMLSGVLFGDRCSPMSTSPLLVSALTDTDLYDNIRGMIRTSIVPFAATCALYLLLGFLTPGGSGQSDVREVFARAFDLRPAALIPAAVILLLSCFRVNVKLSMLVSIAVSVPVALVMQRTAPLELVKIAALGFHPEDARLAALTGGGGIVSMIRVLAIVLISSCYAGIFKGTGFLTGIQAKIGALAEKVTPFGAALLTSFAAGMIACNQTLAIMLTHQLCEELTDDASERAMTLENTAVLTAPLIPWSIAGQVPLSSVGAPAVCVLTAAYLWLVPLYNLAISIHERRKHK